MLTPKEISRLKFGRLVWRTKVLAVIGPRGYGAAKAAMAGGQLPGPIGTLIQHAETASIPASATNLALLGQAIKTLTPSPRGSA